MPGFFRILLCCFLLPAGFSSFSRGQESVPEEMRPYVGARTVVDQPLTEVQRSLEDLKGLVPASSQEELPPLLQKVGEAVRAMFEDFPRTTALERVSQDRTEPGLAEQLYRQQDYYYLISPQENIADVGFEEYRTERKDDRLTPEALKGSFLLTSGYATHPIYFHPVQQKGSRFRYLGRQKSEGNAHVLAFAQRPEISGVRRYLRVRDQTVPILLQGFAWVDPASCQIVRMHTGLLAPRKDAGLESQNTAIRFGEVRFKGVPRSFWLPMEVSVTMRIQGYFFRNRHRYSQYRLFNVESQEGPIVPIKP